jgi:DNA-binding beta-propeller fold protein YncE
MSPRRYGALATVVAGAALLVGPRAAAGQTYWAYVANESSDLVSLVRFDGARLVEEKTIPVGRHPADIDGAHGISVSPKGESWYVSIAHGQPFGQVWRMATGTDELVDSTTVGRFPATMALTPDGASLYVVNFNLHGDHVASSVSAVFTPFMDQLAQIETCVMPHGSRISHDGRRHYSVCMMSDQLVEISTQSMDVARRMSLAPGHEGPLEGAHAGHDMAAMGSMPMEGACKPTWVTVAPDDRHLYLPCNGRGEVLEVVTETMTVGRRFPTGRGPYNADVTPDGRTLVVTLKGEQAVALIDLETGTERRVSTSQPVTHGVVVTPDGRWALVTNEAVGATRGTVDAVDLEAARVVATVEVQYQAGGIGFWKMEG